MKKAAAEVGIQPSRVHPHAFRHTYGRQWPDIALRQANVFRSYTES